jgi:hypothetical protein
MAINTTFNPLNISDFRKDGLNFNAQGIKSTASALTSTNIDFKISGDQLLTGAEVLCSIPVFGDSITFQVVDVDGIFAPVGTVLNQFVTNWYLAPDSTRQVNLQVIYPAKIYNGLYLRLVYISTGNITIVVAVNYTLHSVLI